MTTIQSSLQSIKAYQIGGVPPSTLAYCMENASHLDQYQDLMEEYYLVYWSGKYILQGMSEGLIKSKNKLYHVSFAPNLSRGAIMRNDSLQQYKMSFRRALPCYNLPAFVYISLP